MNIQLTYRDRELMRWINSVGTVTIGHIAQWMCVAQSTAYGRVGKLVKHRYVKYIKLLSDKPGVYQVDAKGAEISESPYPVPKGITLGSYHHDILVTSVCLWLAQKNQCHYTPERALRHATGRASVGQRGHTPDGVLHKNQNNIAIEVELSKKGNRRREKIFQHYRKNFDYEEVWYFCANAEIKRQVENTAKPASFIKIFSLVEHLPQLGDRHESCR